jgi:hypothetical protein
VFFSKLLKLLKALLSSRVQPANCQLFGLSLDFKIVQDGKFRGNREGGEIVQAEKKQTTTAKT